MLTNADGWTYLDGLVYEQIFTEDHRYSRRLQVHLYIRIYGVRHLHDQSETKILIQLHQSSSPHSFPPISTLFFPASSLSSFMLPLTQYVDCSGGSAGTMPCAGHTMPAFLFCSLGDSCYARLSTSTSLFSLFHLSDQPPTPTSPGALLSLYFFF